MVAAGRFWAAAVRVYDPTLNATNLLPYSANWLAAAYSYNLPVATMKVWTDAAFTTSAADLRNSSSSWYVPGSSRAYPPAPGRRREQWRRYRSTTRRQPQLLARTLLDSGQLAQVSAHFGIGQDGEIIQWVSVLGDMAWAEMNGNPSWYSIKT